MMTKLLYIGNKLSKHGNTTTSIETLGSFLEDEGYTVFYASTKKNKIFRLFDMIFTTFKCASKVDYVLIDIYSTQNFWFGVIISQMCRVLHLKYIAKLHGGNLPNRLITSPFFCDIIFKNAYKITAPSNYLLEAFQTKYNANLVYIPNTIEIEKYPFTSREFEVPKLLWVRSFSKIYNPKMAIKVFAALKNEFPSAELCMVGPDKENLIQKYKIYAKSLHVMVDFTGKMEKDDWIELSKKYNVFINTTHFDNTPVSVIEAMALGLPIVSTNVGGIPFLLSDNENAYLVDDNAADQMVIAIKKIIQNPSQTQQIVTKARKYVSSFDWSQVKTSWIDILK